MSDSDGTKTIRTTKYAAMLNELQRLRAENAALAAQLAALQKTGIFRPTGE